jgi:DNA-binding NarL/FixJ family response regulator
MSPETTAALAALGKRDRQLLVHVGRGLDNQQISEELHLSVASVKTYLSCLQSNLGLYSRDEMEALAKEADLA